MSSSRNNVARGKTAFRSWSALGVVTVVLMEGVALIGLVALERLVGLEYAPKKQQVSRELE